MLFVISPAKTLNFDTPVSVRKCTIPVFLDEAQGLVKRLKKLSDKDIAKLMGVSAKIAELNYHRYQQWCKPFTMANAKQAVWAFRGDVYTSLEADSFKQEDIKFAQKHLRMLSGLYGVLRPLDLIQAYRLEMGTQFVASRGSNNLYEFWGNKITECLNRDLKSTRSKTLINLASQEYFKSVHKDHLDAQVITPVFKERRSGVYKVISFVAKRARGMMSRYIINRQIDNPSDIKKFKEDDYHYNKQLSDDANWVFTRG